MVVMFVAVNLKVYIILGFKGVGNEGRRDVEITRGFKAFKHKIVNGTLKLLSEVRKDVVVTVNGAVKHVRINCHHLTKLHSKFIHANEYAVVIDVTY